MHTKHQKAGIKATRGLSLVEVLVASAIGLVVILGSAQSLMFAIQSGAVARSVLTENDFNQTISKILSEPDNCAEVVNALSNSEKEKQKATITKLFFAGESADPVIESGKTFKGDIDVVKMELEKKSDTKRTVTVYYKKNNVGELNTIANKECTANKTDACYTKKCDLSYTYDQSDNTANHACQARDCEPIVLTAGFGSPYKCPYGQIFRWDDDDCNGKSPPLPDKCCDPVETPENNCSVISNTIAGPFGGDSRKEKKTISGVEQCVCENGYVQGVDGRCYVVFNPLQNAGVFKPYNNLYEAELNSSCPSISSFFSSATQPQSLKEKFKDAFCEKEKDDVGNYRGVFNCIKWMVHKNDVTTTTIKPTCGLPDTKYPCNNSWCCVIYLRRIYNRETGRIACLKTIINKQTDVSNSVHPEEIKQLFMARPPWE